MEISEDLDIKNFLREKLVTCHLDKKIECH